MKMTKTNTKRIRAGYEPIPGYVLEEVIGRGGFGEVWRANAPGGLKKAIKFVFGTQDQSRGSRELRSLERIKGVCHPFLLTLERFEAIDDQLVIVTELADCSLEDVFKRNRDRGSCGIPRDTLLSYIYDAADALDYLHERYQLQHLDIKPGNLLLVGGHVKVADFGLLKDLRDVECSIVGGLTPIYAPPEVFDGRPSMHSDQYSLAVMYQELLTGTRPFSGRTIAQLATQHVHSAPNLESLPPSDRPIIAKALEKNPERRFPKCKDFVDALKVTRGKGTTVTSFGEDFVSGDTKRVVNGISAAAAVDDLPQLSDHSQGKNGTRSTTGKPQAVVVALGGTGADCLREIRRRAADIHSASTLDLHSVLIDTDMETIHSMRVAEASDRVAKCELVHTPLRSAHEYRQDGTERLKTISRRWIYNVPRSGSTEGMRTLGRLALVDHGPVVKQRLKETVEALAAAAAGFTPSVYVVGSLTGGTSSGMYIDVVHLLRHLLDEAGLEEVQILSMLATAPFESDPAHPLALHDAQAAMMEMRYFLQAGNGYPGDGGAGWPSVPAARTPLHDVYLVAGRVRGSNSPTPVETITDYIWSDATGAGDLLAAARKLETKESSSIVPPSLRSVGVVPLADIRIAQQKALAPAVVRELLVQWLGLPSQARRTAVPLADRLMRRAGISADTIIQEVSETLLTPSHRESLQRAVADLSPQQQHNHVAVAAALQSVIESMMAQGNFQTIPTDVLSNVQRELTVCLSDRRADLTTVIECLKLTREKIAGLKASCQDDPQPDAQNVLDEQDSHTPVEVAAARLIASHYFGQLSASLNSLQQRLEEFATVLALAIVESSKSQASDENPWDLLPKEIRSEFDSVELALHETTVSRYLLRALSNRGSSIDANVMVYELHETVVPIVTSLFNDNQDAFLKQSMQLASAAESDSDLAMTSFDSSEFPVDTITQRFQPQRAGRNADEPLSVEEALAVVKPTLLAFGGLQRLILVVGNEQDRGRLEPQVRALHKGSLTVAIVPGSTAKLIHEAQQVELTHILSRLTILNGSNAQVTGRLASRTDIVW